MSTQTPSHRPLRRDAERNRQRILEAARVVFAREGLEVSLDAIAREAGVGVGTVYRRFASKEQLIEALFEESLAELVGAARDALAVEDPWEGFLAFLQGGIDRQTRDRGLKELLMGSAHGREQIAGAREEIVPLVTELVERAQRSGQLRDDIAPSDFPLIQFAVGAIGEYTADVQPDAWRRVMGLLIDGLRVRRDAPTPLPVGALQTEDIECAMRDWRPRRR
jgi:AcrR family transcriptional regulator